MRGKIVVDFHHQIDTPDRAIPLFPAVMEKYAREMIRETVSEVKKKSRFIASVVHAESRTDRFDFMGEISAEHSREKP